MMIYLRLLVVWLTSTCWGSIFLIMSPPIQETNIFLAVWDDSKVSYTQKAGSKGIFQLDGDEKELTSFEIKSTLCCWY